MVRSAEPHGGMDVLGSGKCSSNIQSPLTAGFGLALRGKHPAHLIVPYCRPRGQWFGSS
jgi:hypothetical protein